jgi:hypothetical protein
MLKNFITFALLLCSLLSQGSASLPNETPRQFYVKQHWLSFTTTFDIETDQLKLGTVHRKFFSLSPVKYEFYDYESNLQASASMRWLSWGATFDIADAAGGTIGTVEQRLFSFFPTFEILSPVGHVLAIAKMNFWGTSYTLSDPVTRQPMALLSRPFFRLKDNWTVTLTNPELYHQKQIDPRLFILVMAFQTDRDAWTAQRRLLEEQNRQRSQFSMIGSLDNAEIDRLESLKEQLSICRKKVDPCTPTEEEAELVDQRFQLLGFMDDETGSSELDRVAAAFTLLSPLLDNDSLSLGEKSALLKLFETRLRKMDYQTPGTIR